MEATAEDFVSVGEVLRRTGWAKESLRRRLHNRGIQLFIDPNDERARLIRRVDAERLQTPRPVGRLENAAAA
jgi:hypothetical protein